VDLALGTRSTTVLKLFSSYFIMNWCAGMILHLFFVLVLRLGNGEVRRVECNGF